MNELRPKSDYVVASRIDYGKSQRRMCIFCKSPVYPVDKTVSYAAKRFKCAKRKRYLCFECFTQRFDAKKHALMPTPDAKKLLGMSSNEIRKFTKIMVAAKREQMKDETVAS
jgi:hypothetical protein